MSYTLPDLPYAHDALAPYIDEETMKIHHGKHHNGYTNKLNNALKEANLENENLKDLFSRISELPAGVRNNGGGYFNHDLFWQVMSPDGGGKPSSGLKDAINESFGSFEAFKESFKKAAAGRFGSGWAWLIVDNSGKLKITSTPNQDNPLMDVADDRGTPIFGLDVWEHAYYLNYQNKRPEYIDNFWNVVNWDEVEKRFRDAQ